MSTATAVTERPDWAESLVYGDASDRDDRYSLRVGNVARNGICGDFDFAVEQCLDPFDPTIRLRLYIDGNPADLSFDSPDEVRAFIQGLEGANMTFSQIVGGTK